MTQNEFSPEKWSLEYRHGNPGIFMVKAGERTIVELSIGENKEESVANAHLIAAAPMLYEALKELLISTDEGLIANNTGCECERCEQAKQASYQAIGFAEGRTLLKEGDSRTY
ncbi:MAG: hypothetical protein HQM13_17045 [SAR324 cluster bacterium]|nr:hypothetical protein [SAR324 cluster bacterium]